VEKEHANIGLGNVSIGLDNVNIKKQKRERHRSRMLSDIRAAHRNKAKGSVSQKREQELKTEIVISLSVQEFHGTELAEYNMYPMRHKQLEFHTLDSIPQQ